MNPKVTKVPGIPKPPADVSPALRVFLEALAEAVEIRLGRRGDPVDRAITLRELIATGLALELRGNPFDPNNPEAGPGFIDPERPTVTDVPLRPTGFNASGAYSQILLFWTFPNYSKHSQTEIWSHPTNSLGDATLTGVDTGRAFIDPVGSGVQRFYWIRHVNTAGTFGPWNSTSGTQAATATDVAHQLAVLGGAIAASELATSLSTPIAKIPGLETFTGYTSSYSGGSLLTRMGAVEGTAGGAVTYAHLNQNHYTKTTANQATAGAITTLASGFANPDGSSGTVTLQQAMTTQLTENGNLKAQYSVKIDNNGHIAGFGLSSTDVDGTPTSAFIVNADKFAVIDPASTADGLGTTTPTAANVPFFIQGGVTYMKAAAILDASITNAKIGILNADRIGAGTIDTDRLGADTIDAQKLKLGGSQLISQQVNGVHTLMIGAAQITTANIGDAQVSTIKIGQNAVTVSDAATPTYGSNTRDLTLAMQSDVTHGNGQNFIFHVNGIVNNQGTNPSTYDMRITTTLANGFGVIDTHWFYAYGPDSWTVRRAANANSQFVRCRVQLLMHGTNTPVPSGHITITGHGGKR